MEALVNCIPGPREASHFRKPIVALNANAWQ